MSEFRIEGMKCESCVAKIRDALAKNGYGDAQVTLNPPVVSFSLRSPTSQEIQTTLSKIGEYKIVETSGASSPAQNAAQETASDERLTPLIIILSYIVGGVLLRAFIAGDYSLMMLMSNFMGGFFIVFSLFKLLNLSGFADAYGTYDIIASRSRIYGLLYPFIELLLGIAYLIGFAAFATNVITLFLMVIGSVGVFQALRTKRSFQCACLGTALKLPMTKVTLVEDVFMGLMALTMLTHQLLG